jgi:tetratricopeptide (TPR) repeat protein
MAKPLRISNNKRRKIEQFIAQATQAYGAKRYDMCENLCKRIEAIHPGSADVASMRGGMCFALYGMDEALPFLIEAVEADPKRIDFQINLGRVYLQKRFFGPAFECYEQAVRLNKKNISALLGCCRALIGLGEFAQARVYLKEVQHFSLHQADDYAMLAAACRDIGDVSDSHATLDELLMRFPDYVHGHFERVVTFLQTGEREKAENAIQRMLELQPSHAKGLAMMADMSSFDSTEDEKFRMISDAYASSDSNSVDRMYLNAAMAYASHKLGDFDSSFDYSKQVNEFRAGKSSYQQAEALAQLDNIVQKYTSEALRQSSGLEDNDPIFIVGMPRCGSTLIEQILVAHPQVIGRGEVDFFEPALSMGVRDASPLSIADTADFGMREWNKVGRSYLERIRAAGPCSSRLIDKFLSNFRLVGAIHCALPEAHIIHVRRNPLDTCLSIYTSFIQGDAHDYGLRLETLGEYYRMYQRVMRHWREVLPEGAMYELDYEQLVNNQEEETRKLLEYCGLDWNEACLSFQQSDARVRTASILQVRKPMYSSSVERWRRYEKHLQPLVDILGAD